MSRYCPKSDTMIRAAILVVSSLLIAYSPIACAQALRSPDGKYEAKPVPSGKDAKDVHYEIRDVATGRLVLRTYAQYPTANDVKAGGFSLDSKRFAAAYHYGHDGNYTWIGVWSVETGKFSGSPIRLDGWSRDVTTAFRGQP